MIFWMRGLELLKVSGQRVLCTLVYVTCIETDRIVAGLVSIEALWMLQHCNVEGLSVW